MSQHEVLSEHQEIPSGFSSYSILLIPDSGWLDKAGFNRSYELFARFKQFGDLIGPEHLALWFFTGIGSYGRGVDLQVFSAIHKLVKSQDEVKQFICEQNESLSSSIDKMGGSYDIGRAKLFCAWFKLNFNKGPYIAFFNKEPYIPVFDEKSAIPGMGGVNRVPEKRPTTPSFILQFYGISFEGVLRMINEIEYQLLQTKPAIGKLEWLQFQQHLTESCKKAAIKLGQSAGIILKIAEAIRPPSL